MRLVKTGSNVNLWCALGRADGRTGVNGATRSYAPAGGLADNSAQWR